MTRELIVVYVSSDVCINVFEREVSSPQPLLAQLPKDQYNKLKLLSGV